MTLDPAERDLPSLPQDTRPQTAEEKASSHLTTRCQLIRRAAAVCMQEEARTPNTAESDINPTPHSPHLLCACLPKTHVRHM